MKENKLVEKTLVDDRYLVLNISNLRTDNGLCYKNIDLLDNLEENLKVEKTFKDLENKEMLENLFYISEHSLSISEIELFDIRDEALISRLLKSVNFDNETKFNRNYFVVDLDKLKIDEYEGEPNAFTIYDIKKELEDFLIIYKEDGSQIELTEEEKTNILKNVLESIDWQDPASLINEEIDTYIENELSEGTDFYKD